MKTLYLCNKEKDCRLSPMCGQACNHTFDENYRKKGDYKEYKLIRTSTGENVLKEMVVEK